MSPAEERMVPREVMQIALLQEQLQQTRLDMAELSARLTKTDARLERTEEKIAGTLQRTDERVQGVLDKLNQLQGGRVALTAIITLTSAVSGTIAFIAGHWK